MIFSSRNRDSRLPDSRKSMAFFIGGVSSTIRS
jgi:hypothetical protein